MAEEKRHATTKRAELIDTGAAILITMIDAAGKIIYASASYRSLLGYDPSGLPGRLFAELAHPDDVAAGKLVLSPPDLTNGALRTRLVRLYCADGGWLSMELSAELVTGQAPPMTVLVARDLNAPDVLEEQHKRIHQLERVRHFTHTLAHDLNNLLTGIGGLASLALQILPPEHQARGDIEGIWRAAARAAVLTRQLRTVAREQMVGPQALHLNDLLYSLVPYVQQLLGEEIELTVRAAPDLGYIQADPLEIEQVIISLVIHAGDLLTDGGKLAIKTANAVLPAEVAHTSVQIEPGDYVMLVVSASSKETSIQPYRCEQTRTTEAPDPDTEGELSMCAALIEQLGGLLWVSGAADGETSITVYMPRVLPNDIERSGS